MNIKIEKKDGKYVGYVDDIPVCKSKTANGVYITLRELGKLPNHVFANALQVN
jgi:hypothetical protein